MPSCLNDIVTLGLCPDETPSLSGFQLINAPGISIRNLGNVATETYIQGTVMAMEKKALTLLQIINDFIGKLQTNRIATTVSQPVYDSSQFNTGTTIAASSSERGIWLHKAAWKGRLRTTYIKAIEVYPLQDGEGTLKIYDGYNIYSFAVDLVGGQVNVFDSANLEDFPFALNPNSTYAKVLLLTDVTLASAPIICHTGCSAPSNDCAFAKGWDGTKEVKKEGYGINVQFYCVCSYEQILCDLAKSFSGELIFLKWQINIWEEHIKSNRFNNWVVYNAEKAQQWLEELELKYNNKWVSLVGGELIQSNGQSRMIEGAAWGLLQTYRDDCVICRGIKFVANI